MWFDNKVCKLIVVKVLHTSLLNITVVAFKVLQYSPWETMHQCRRLVHPSKQFWNWCCGMAFTAAIVLLLMSSVSSKCIPFNISFIFGNQEKLLEAKSGEQGQCSSTAIHLLAKNSLTDSALIQAPTFLRRHTKTHSDSRRHSERD
jgi:hypothetical protein